MKIKLLFLLGMFILLNCTLNAQLVVINEYHNASDVRNEWVELIVVGDNIDMRNWTIRDNISTQTNWQTEVTFANVAFWNNMRQGTIIILRSRIINSSLVNYTIDSNKSDGFIDVTLQTSSLFSGGGFGVSPAWNGISMNIAGAGELIQLRNASDTHVHAVGHSSSVGADWIALPAPKLNHTAAASSGESIFVCPGNRLGQFNGVSGTSFTFQNTSLSLGLPNNCAAGTFTNKTFIDSLRSPVFTSQTVAIDSARAGKIEFNWSAIINPISDTTMGYLILRSSTNAFTAPSNGTTYSSGQSIGTNLIVSRFNNADSITIRDTNGILEGGDYYYRVYAYKYAVDNVLGNSFNSSRGTSYDLVNFVSAQALSILNLNQFKLVKKMFCERYNYHIVLNNDDILNGTLSIKDLGKENYSFWDDGVFTNLMITQKQMYRMGNIITFNYIDLQQVNRQFTLAAPSQLCDNIKILSIFPNPSNGIFQISGIEKKEMTNILLYSDLGKFIMDVKHIENNQVLDFSGLGNGIYQMAINVGGKTQYLNIAIVK